VFTQKWCWNIRCGTITYRAITYMFYSFLLTNWRVVLVTRHLVQFQHLLWKCLGLASNAGYPVVKSLEIRDIFWFPFLISRRTSVVVLAALVQRSVSGMNIAAFSWQFLSFFLLMLPAFWVLSIVAQFFNLLRGQRNERVASHREF